MDRGAYVSLPLGLQTVALLVTVEGTRRLVIGKDLVPVETDIQALYDSLARSLPSPIGGATVLRATAISL